MSKQTSSVKTGERVIFIVTIIFLVLAAIGFGIMEYVRQHSDKPMFASNTHYNFTKEGERGMRLFFRKGNCTDCHRALNSGTNMGAQVDLDGEGSKRSVTWLEDFMRMPEKTYHGPTLDHGPGKAAAYVATFPPEELRAIAVFLSELKADSGSAVAPTSPKGKSPFVESMVKKFAPDSWKSGEYRDMRSPDAEVEKR